jgi:hypothetical protein
MLMTRSTMLGEDLLDWQNNEIATASVLRRYGISTPRQNGKTEIGVEVAIRAAALDDKSVLYMSHTYDGCRDVFDRCLRKLEDGNHWKIKQVTRSYGNLCIRFYDGGVIRFYSYGSNGGGRGFSIDQLILDDWSGDDSFLLKVLPMMIRSNDPHTLYLGVDLEVNGVPVTRYGAGKNDDPSLESTWRKANPSHVLFRPEHFEESRAALGEEFFNSEILNIRK